MAEHEDLLEILEQLDPAQLSYQEWVNVGMGLKESGYPQTAWEEWSRRDPGRYHPGECEKKWASFRGATPPITGGTIVQMALDRGWQPRGSGGHELDWNAAIGAKEAPVVVDREWLENKEVVEPADWDPASQLIRYLEALFDSTENVGYVTRSWEKEGRHMPTKGCWDRTAGQLIAELSRCQGDIGKVLGDYDPIAGAWIRFNPLDGKGVKNEDVTDFRYALVESDELEIDRQNAIIRELELPVAALVHSGGKSLHAIVRVEAAGYEEYRKRVDYLYAVCQKNGLRLDTQNKNPSRLSRMPGVLRAGRKQFLVDTHIGKSSWQEWREWVESVNDDLPDPESMADAWENLPELSPPLIEGVLRQGHKLLLAGPSKAGKSYALIELCCSVAEGRPWLGFGCAQGRILYVNLELDRASCLHRFRDVYTALGWQPGHLQNIDVWNLRGRSVPMDKLAPKLIRRAMKKDYIAIVIDPIYKVITGDENSADQMAAFCNQFDKVCTELGCAVIYCHHHSKGVQGAKRSMDRASGSGVFARDPDALLDLIELERDEAVLAQEKNKAACAVCMDWLRRRDLAADVSPDDACSRPQLLDACRRLIPEDLAAIEKEIRAAERAADARTAWRVESTLREFPKFPPVNLWFDYPIHRVDGSGVLGDIQPDGDAPAWQKKSKKTAPARDRQKERREKLANAFALCDTDGSGAVSIGDLAEYSGLTRNTLKSYVDENPDFERGRDGLIRRVSKVSKP